VTVELVETVSFDNFAIFYFESKYSKKL